MADGAPAGTYGAGRAGHASLRRVDWRFLLLLTRVDSAVTGADERLNEGVGAIAGSVSTAGSAGPSTELVALADARSRELRSATRSLAQGGACYVEWNRPRVAGVWRTRWRFRRLGLGEPECYWVWPPPRSGRSQYWLPLTGRGAARCAARYFLTSRAPRRGLGKALSGMRRAVWLAARSLGCLAPMCAVARRGGLAVGGGGSLADEIRSSWTDWGLGPAPSKVTCLMLTGGTNERNKIVVLGFPDGSPQPGVVLKLARSSISEPGLVREARVLGAIHQSPLATVVDIPQVAFSGRIGGALAVAETAVHGQPISTRLTEGTFAATTLEMATTLGSAVREAAAVPAGEWFDRLVSPVAADFRRRFDGMVSPPSVERQLRALRSLPPLPLVVEHRDCSPWNVLRTPQGRLALVDWESSEPIGLPFLDLMYFAVNAAFLVEGALGSGREGETYGRIIGSSTLNSAVSAAVEEYCTVGRLPLDAARPLATFAWMLHACTEHERLVADDVAAGGVGSGAEANSTFLTLWRMDTGQAGAASSRPDPEA